MCRLISTYDVFLGVVHASEHTKQYLYDMRQYMPRLHREWLTFLGSLSPTLPEYVSHSGNPGLVASYNAAIDAVSQFRQAHINIVALYILAQARTGGGAIAHHASPKNNPDTPQPANPIEERGTGGTSIMPFLKTSRNNIYIIHAIYYAY
jgi:indoleamine 2,3-dioxygenase